MLRLIFVPEHSDLGCAADGHLACRFWLRDYLHVAAAELCGEGFIA
jgi:hypothetical protein